MAFSIPAQSLNSAISRYGDATGSEALYDASLAAGRLSNNVEGRMTPPEALDRLLIGTGLSARFISISRFVVTQSPSVIGAGPDRALAPAHRRYYGVVQQELLDALCGLHEARPGHYRLILALRITPIGTVEYARRIGTVGSSEADRQIDSALRGVRFSNTPPADFAQPIRILLAPDKPGAASACAGADLRLGAWKEYDE